MGQISMRVFIALLISIFVSGCVPSYRFADRKTKIIPNHLINADSLLVYKPFIPYFSRRVRFDTIEARILEGLQSRLGLSKKVEALKPICLACHGNYYGDSVIVDEYIPHLVREFQVEASCLDSCIEVPANKTGMFLIINPEYSPGIESRDRDILSVSLFMVRGTEIIYYRHFRGTVYSTGKYEGEYKWMNYMGRLPTWSDAQIELVIQGIVEDLRKRLY